MYKSLEDLPVDPKSLQEATKEALPEQPVEEQPQAETPVESAQEQSQQEAKQSPQEMNFRALREKAERLERERDEALRVAQEAAKYQQYQQPQQEEVEDDSIAESDLVEGKHLKQVKKQLKQIQNDFKNYQQQSSLQIIEAQLKSQYPDFDKVVTKENMADLRYAFPEIGRTIDSSSDWHAKAVSAYTMLKNLGIYKEDKFEKDRARVNTNSTKPRPVAALNSSAVNPLDSANAFENGLTEDLKKTLLKEMRDSAKRS